MTSKFLFIPFVVLFLASVSAWSKTLVVIDAAHGGSDTGVKNGSEVEKDWTYKFAQALQKALENAGYAVVQARKGDSTLPVEKRAEAINATQAAAVIVLHAERDWSGKQRGAFLVVEPPTQGSEFTEASRWGAIPPSLYKASLRLARSIARQLGIGTDLSSLSDTRGLAGENTVPGARLYCLPQQSLRYLSLPAVVVNPMYLSSAEDMKKFSSSSEIADLAQQVAQGVVDFLQ